MNETEDDFERELTTLLAREAAPASLAASVMHTVAAESGRLHIFPKRPVWPARIAAGFVLLMLLLGGGIKHRRKAEARAKQARAEQDFAKSIEITNHALEPMRRHLQRAGITLDE